VWIQVPPPPPLNQRERAVRAGDAGCLAASPDAVRRWFSRVSGFESIPSLENEIALRDFFCKDGPAIFKTDNEFSGRSFRLRG